MKGWTTHQSANKIKESRDLYERYNEIKKSKEFVSPPQRPSPTEKSKLESEVSESHFFILETKMRISLIQSRTSRRDREFLTLSLRLQEETEKRSLPISGIETRSRFIIFTLRHRDENENSLDLISIFETRPRILKLAIFP